MAPMTSKVYKITLAVITNTYRALTIQKDVTSFLVQFTEGRNENVCWTLSLLSGLRQRAFTNLRGLQKGMRCRYKTKYDPSSE